MQNQTHTRLDHSFRPKRMIFQTPESQPLKPEVSFDGSSTLRKKLDRLNASIVAKGPVNYNFRNLNNAPFDSSNKAPPIYPTKPLGFRAVASNPPNSVVPNNIRATRFRIVASNPPNSVVPNLDNNNNDNDNGNIIKNSSNVSGSQEINIGDENNVNTGRIIIR